MTKEELAKQAFEECCNPKTTTRYGVRRGNPFWNVESTIFMYVPAFHFTAIRDCEHYRFRATDEAGTVHTFESSDCCALLTPIWGELPEGVVTLTVNAVNADGTDGPQVGARTFFRSSPFPGDTPPAVCSYRESANKALKFAFEQGFVQSWLDKGVPDPAYDLNVYPSKMISSLVMAMLSYARICPEEAEKAMKVAVNAADYLIEITPRGEEPLANLPPTYHLDYCPDPEKYGIITPNWTTAERLKDTIMMIYPPRVGRMYLSLYKATRDERYLKEALNIGEYFKRTVLPNGTWYLVRSCKTGEPVKGNCISPMEVMVPFMTELYDATGEKCWQKLAEDATNYSLRTQLPAYNWEGQFEDSGLSTCYTNLTHYEPVALANYLVEHRRNDPASVEIAKELMRFAEDQFVLWKRPYPWAHISHVPGRERYETSTWHTPCAMEQYNWYVPIDASTACMITGFLNMYKAGLGGLYLAKAKALADQITRVQLENGQIPTHWMDTSNMEGHFWFNCMFASCIALEKMAEYENVEP